MILGADLVAMQLGIVGEEEEIALGVRGDRRDGNLERVISDNYSYRSTTNGITGSV